MLTFCRVGFAISFRRGSTINTDRFHKQAPKLLRMSGDMTPREIFWILTLSRPFSLDSESFRQDIDQFHSSRTKYLSIPFSIFQLGIFFIKNIFIMKNLTDFRKTVETSVDPRLSVHFLICLWLHIKVPLTPR